MWFLTLIVFIFILGIIVLVHELGHFLWARAFGVHIYEFSIGMGPIIFTHKGKDGINYNIRALPIGGFVAMAGEVYEDDKKVKKEKFLCNKPIWQRIVVMAAGVVNNFIMAILILFAIGIIWGSTTLTPKVLKVEEGSPMEKAGVTTGDVILSINNHKASSYDEAVILLYYKNKTDYYEFRIKHKDGSVEDYKITPEIKKDEVGNETKVFGVYFDQSETHGFLNKIRYAFEKFWSIVKSMWLTVAGLVTGKISINALSGPVGIFTVVDESINTGLYTVIYLIAYLSINVGVINIIPFPAFDGGHILFLIIEKIKGSPVNQKFEDMCHKIGFALLMILIVIVSINDILRIFK